MSKVSNVWVFSDAANRLEEVMSGAKELGEKVICFVMNAEDAKKVFVLGADEALVAKEGELAENLVPSFAKALNGQNGIVLMPNSRRCKDVRNPTNQILKANQIRAPITQGVVLKNKQHLVLILQTRLKIIMIGKA